MLVVTHELFVKSQPADVRIEIRVYQPIQFEKDWGCRYEIDWPEGSKVLIAYGLDALQALVIALKLIGTELYNQYLSCRSVAASVRQGRRLRLSGTA